jgi:hypothetical protein
MTDVTLARCYGGELNGQVIAVPWPLIVRISHKYVAEVTSFNALEVTGPPDGAVVVQTQWYTLRTFAVNANLLERREVHVYVLGNEDPAGYVERVRADFNWPADSDIIVAGPITYPS